MYAEQLHFFWEKRAHLALGVARVRVKNLLGYTQQAATAFHLLLRVLQRYGSGSARAGAARSGRGTKAAPPWAWSPQVSAAAARGRILVPGID